VPIGYTALSGGILSPETETPVQAPCGILMVQGEVHPEAVARALNEQGGPPWDETAYQMVTGVDLASLVSGRPVAGTGTAVSVASSGWWLRSLDDLADRLAMQVGKPVLAAFESETAAASGYHLADPKAQARRGMEFADRAASPREWVSGLSSLLDTEIAAADVLPLPQVAREVHHDDPSGAHLPGMFAFRLGPMPSKEWRILTEVRGQGLLSGADWQPTDAPEISDEPPGRLRVIVIQGPVRLPGPPRLATAGRVQAVEAAKEVLDDDGWVCLVPEVNGVVAIYGSAVRVRQLAPVSSRRYLGVIHPLAAVRVGPIRDGYAYVRPVQEEGPPDTELLETRLARMLELLEENDWIRWNEDELRAAADPASLLAWQIPVDVARSQQYLGGGDPVVRLEVLISALEHPIVTDEDREVMRPGAGEPTVTDLERPVGAAPDEAKDEDAEEATELD